MSQPHLKAEEDSSDGFGYPALGSMSSHRIPSDRSAASSHCDPLYSYHLICITILTSHSTALREFTNARWRTDVHCVWRLQVIAARRKRYAKFHHLRTVDMSDTLEISRNPGLLRSGIGRRIDDVAQWESPHRTLQGHRQR